MTQPSTRDRLVLAALLIAIACGCSLVGSADLSGSVVAFDTADLSEDQRSVDVVVLGPAPMAAGEPCGADFAGTSRVNGRVLEVQVRQTATRDGQCQMDKLICCPHHIIFELADETTVDSVRDLGSPLQRILFLERPAELYDLQGIPAGWELRKEWPEWGGTWVRLYSPVDAWDARPVDTLTFGSTFGGQIISEPEYLEPSVIVHGEDAQYQRYPDMDNQIQLQWLADGQKLWLEAFERHFTIDDLVALADGATAP